MTDGPRVSILIPSYNHAEYFRACLDSVRAQTFTDWEVVIVDDGSTDGSDLIACEYAFSDRRIRATSNESNLGTYGTEQRALGLARGDLVAILNSDDLWLPDKLALQVAALDANPGASACYTLGWMVDEHGAIQEEDVHADWPQKAVQDALPCLLAENRILASSVVFRREGLRFHTDLRYSGDWVALLEAAMRGPFCCVAERATSWRQHSRNTYRMSPRQALEEVRVREAILQDSENWRGERAILPWEAGEGKNAINLFALYALFGETAAARSLLGTMLQFPNRWVALKRWGGILMGSGRLARHLWREQAEAGVDLDAFPPAYASQRPLAITAFPKGQALRPDL
ncbi:MAG: glycosyltransferase family 2 protein [Fimbriimonadaceae bacterium]|nr:glycosyltransferase family 2 protein [Fimbriimonadaceae bacterium]QYK56377.1 MAG: glycosyltransferase family 2 protein [Fimbriimonadaceae bacterium]